MKHFLIALTLICTLSTAAFAGEIPSVGAAAQVTTTEKTDPSSSGLMPMVGSESLSDSALSVALAVLSLVS